MIVQLANFFSPLKKQLSLEPRLWPFVLLTILSRLWDAMNGEIFRGETASGTVVVRKVCDDFVIWQKWLKVGNLVNSLNDP
jgi:hypothetical protein